MIHPKTLQITLQHPDSTGWSVSATLTTSDGLAYRREDKLALSENWEAELRSLTLQPDRYGEYLGRALFHDNIRDICKEALSSTTPTRLYLVIEAPQLQTLRWERLYYPDDTNIWASLAQNQQLLFSYYTPSLSSRNYAALHQRDLRALVVVCSPPVPYHGFQPFDASTLAQQLEDSFGERIPHTILATPSEATWPKLLEHLNTEAYPLLHIIAHGYYDEDRQESYLLLLDEQQQPTLVSATAFTQPLKHANRLPHLIFFSSCETATPAANLTPHGHFARQVLDQWGTPAVIAMSDTVSVATAAALAEAFYPHLYHEAHVDQALTKAGMALQQRADRYLPVLYQRLAGKALFSKDPKRHDELNQLELEQGLEKLAPLVQQRAPVAQAEFDQLAATIRTHRHNVSTLNTLNQFCHDVTDISFATLVQDKDGSQLVTYNTECPFPGMRPFKAGDAPNAPDYRKYFFGRDHTVTELLQRLEHPAVLAVIGASGSGKSSLVFAGLIPALEQHTAQQGQQLQVISLRPACRSGQGALAETPQHTLQHKLQGLDATQPALVYVDQFEELFTLCQFADKAYQEQVRNTFLQTLLALPQQYPLLKVVLTIRDDFTGDAASYPALKAILQDHAFLLACMNAAELRTAIEQQAAAVNLIFEQGLVHQILSEVDGEPGAMPLLQHLLWLLWQRRRGRYLRTAEYTAIGGVKKAISETAGKLFHHYHGDNTAQKYLRNIFLRLTRPGRESIEDNGEYYRDTRQRIPRSNLYPSDANPTLIDTLITHLADERLIVTYQDDVEIAHESLITYWDTLRDWLKDRQLIEMQQGLVDAARNWQQARLQHAVHSKDLLLHRGSRIKDVEQQQMLNRLFLTQMEEDYLKACRQQDKRDMRNQRYVRIFAVVMLCLFVLAGTFLVLAVKQKHKADDYLMQQYLYRGIELRDSQHQVWDKAEKYFAKALDVAVNETQKENLWFAYADLHRFAFTPKQTIHHEAVQGVQTLTDKPQILTWSSDGTVQRWDTRTWESLGTIKLDFVTGEYHITDLKLFADNKRLLVRGGDTIEDTVRIVDAMTGESLSNPMQYKQAVEGAELFAGDTRIVIWDREGTARIWNAVTGEVIGQPMPHGEALGAFAFAKDTRILTWSEQEGSVQLWNAATGMALGQPKEYEWGVTGAQKFADDRRVLIWTIDGIAQVWDTATWTPIGKPMRHEGVIYGAHIFADDSKILTWSQDGTARIWNASSGELIGKPMYHEKGVNKALIFANNTRILTLSTENGTARVWDAATGEPLSQPLRQQHDVHTFPDATQVLTWDKNGVISVWDMAMNQVVSQSMQHRKSVSGMQLFASDSRVLTWSDDGTAQIWDMATRDKWGQTMTHDKAIRGAKVFANETRIVTWSDDGTAKLWDASTGQVVGKPMRHSQRVKGAQLIANDTRLVTWSEDGFVWEWDATNGNAIGDAKYLDDAILGLKLFSDNTHLLTWGSSGAQVIDTATGKRQFLNLQNGHRVIVWGAEVFADDTQILTWDNDHIAQVWDAARGETRGQPMIHEKIIRGAKVFANNTRVLTWSNDETARIWEATTGKAIGHPMVHKYSVDGAQVFSHDTKILTWNWNGTAQIWDATTGAAISLPIGYGQKVRTAQVFANNKQVLIWGEDGEARIWDLPVTEKSNHFTHEIKQGIESASYFNTAGDLIFLTPDQLGQCKKTYQSFKNCNESNSLICNMKRHLWSFQKFFGIQPTIEDCLNSKDAQHD